MNTFLLCLFAAWLSNAQEIFLQTEASPTTSTGFNKAQKQNVRVWTAQTGSALKVETSRLVVHLPDGVHATLNKKKSRIEGSRIHWQGRVEGDPFGQAALVQNGSQLNGEISVGGRRFVISSTQKQVRVLETEDIDIEGPYTDAPTPDFSSLTAVTTTSTDNFIDVMVLYTDDVGVNADAEDTLRARVDSVNEMLAASCANFRYRLVYIAQVTYAETGVFATDLTALAGTSDGTLDSIHTLRDTYGADLVQMITDTGDACGLGYLGQEGFFNEDYGFSVSSYWCNARTMAHEWGHNLSISHDRYEEDVALTEETLLLDGYGYVDLANKYRDVMSYSTHCTALGVTCTILEMFSNANITHNSIPFGMKNYANSASRMNEAFPYVANFRTAVSSYAADIDNNCVSSSDNKDLHCFVASTVYKSYHHDNVFKLRAFRDKWLQTHPIGKSFVRSYYKYSPYWAQTLQQHSWLMSLIAFVLSALIFIFENIVMLFVAQMFVLALVFAHRRKMSFKILAIFLLWSVVSVSARAQIATSSHFIYLAGENPSVRLLREAKPYASAQYLKEKQNIETSGYSEEHDSSRLNLMLAHISTDYFFEIQFTPTYKYEHTIQQTGFSDTVIEYAEQEYNVQAGSHFFGLPVGFRYKSEKIENISNTSKTKNRAIGVGTTLELMSYMNVGLGTDFREQTGDGLAKAQWLQPYLGLAVGQMPQKSHPTQGLNEFFLEAGLSRAPEVQNTEGTAVTSIGEMNETFLSGEFTINTGLTAMDQFFARVSSKSRKEKATSYILEEIETSTLSTHLGFTLPYGNGDKLFIGVLFEQAERKNSIVNETEYLGFTISYHGQAGMASTPSRSFTR